MTGKNDKDHDMMRRQRGKARAPHRGDKEQPSAQAPIRRPREVGGREGPDPTRYGDWEYKGRCIDF
ncbi:MAG: DUF1674 domain-containing protein [Gammaproteobacteria bacterium]